MTGAWASLVDRATAPIRAAGNPYPRDLAAGGTPGVQWTVNTSAAHSITALDPWNAVATTEATAMSIPAFKQGVDIISGTCGAMPLWAHRGSFARVPPAQILQAPDPDVPASVTWSRLYRDVVLYPYGWMLVTERYANGFPARMRHVPFTDVSVAPEGIYVDGIRVADEDIKRFDNPFAPGALTHGARILSLAAAIETAVRRFATFDIPSGYLKQTGGPDLLDSEIDDLLAAWEAARQNRSTGYLNTSLDYKTTAFDAKQLQLVEARQAITQDIARLLNLPPSAVNAETGGSLTYSTVAMQQEGLQSQTLWPYLSAVRDRLTMNDLTPNGTRVEIPSLGFLRTDLPQRANAYQALISQGVLTVEEARGLEQLPPLDFVDEAPENRLP